MEFQTPTIYLHLIRAIALLVPKQFRPDWRREWEAEVISHWMQLEKWERLNAKSKFDLLKRVKGALRDVVWFQQGRTSSTLVTLNLIVCNINRLRRATGIYHWGNLQSADATNANQPDGNHS